MTSQRAEIKIYFSYSLTYVRLQ